MQETIAVLLCTSLQLYNFTALLFDQQTAKRLVSLVPALDRIDKASGQRSLSHCVQQYLCCTRMSSVPSVSLHFVSLK